MSTNLEACTECGAINHGNMFCNTCRIWVNENLGLDLPPWPHPAEKPCGAEEVKAFIQRLHAGTQVHPQPVNALAVAGDTTALYRNDVWVDCGDNQQITLAKITFATPELAEAWYCQGLKLSLEAIAPAEVKCLERANAEAIVIERLSGGGFNVRFGNRNTDQLTFDEMLGVVAALTMPDDQKGRYSRWFRTQEEREAEREVREARRRMSEQPALADLRGL